MGWYGHIYPTRTLLFLTLYQSFKSYDGYINALPDFDNELFLDNYILHAKYPRFPINTQLIGPPFRLMAENVIVPTREFRKLILSKRGFQAASFDRCLHYVRRGVSLWQPVTHVTILNLEKKKKIKSLSYRKRLII